MPARSLRVPLVIFALAAWLRVLFDDVTQFSRADETQYLLLTRRLVDRGFFAGYADLVREHLADSSRWVSPSPLRIGHLALTTFACHVAGDCTYGTLAAVSTIAGVAIVPLTWAIGRELLPPRAATLGALFVALSPLQLALGRRALQDAPATALALAAVWAYLRLLSAPTPRARGWAAAATLLAGAAMAEKFTFVAYAPVYAALWWTRPGPRALRSLDFLPALAPAFPWALYSAVTESPRAYFEMVHIELHAIGQPYSQQYQGGPPSRTVIDLVALCPITTLLAVGALAVLAAGPRTLSSRGARRLAWVTLAAALVVSLGPKAVRWSLGLDAFACLLAGWLVSQLASRANRPLVTLASAVALTAAVNLSIFERVFWTGGVYDPTTYDVLKALEMIPR